MNDRGRRSGEYYETCCASCVDQICAMDPDAPLDGWLKEYGDGQRRTLASWRSHLLCIARRGGDDAETVLWRLRMTSSDTSRQKEQRDQGLAGDTVVRFIEMGGEECVGLSILFSSSRYGEHVPVSRIWRVTREPGFYSMPPYPGVGTHVFMDLRDDWTTTVWGRGLGFLPPARTGKNLLVLHAEQGSMFNCVGVARARWTTGGRRCIDGHLAWRVPYLEPNKIVAWATGTTEQRALKKLSRWSVEPEPLVVPDDDLDALGAINNL